ncbi:CapA family protein [Polyangium aurulentum]|uniref:CapA family protein n=1 Tax=Polyangium aurulentum TaxID=2567896 RepID=UPI0010AE4FBA|nr:CapA family protein [Polyangium aurulentum]UQA57918.1 CapA family protein [Polyangium aurulentum]
MAKTRTTKRSLRPTLALLAAAGLLALCPAEAGAYQFDTTEASFDTTYAATSIALSGTIVDEAGIPIPSAALSIVGWGDGAANASATTSTGGSGTFSLSGLKRRSVLLRVDHPGYYTELVPVDLHRPLAETTASAGAIVMTARKAGRVRLVFGGDTMFGRRFTDADQDGVEGEPGDLINADTRADDAKSIIAYMRDVLSAGDYTMVNLESPVTSATLTAHPYKSFTFFSHPDTLSALTYAGIDGVDLANNHMFDYLTTGVTDTMTNVSAYGLDWSGVGINEDVAKLTTVYRTLNNVPLSLLGFSEMTTDGSTEDAYLLVARDPTKAGALQASSTNLSDFTSDEAPERFAIPMIHGGSEYTDYPTNGMRSKFVSLAKGGAGIIVAHHPHTIHGIGLVGSRFVIMSLGNFIFDQDIFETFQSFVAVADVDVTSAGAYDVRRLQLVPFHIEGYSPKMVTGDWLARAGRHIGHLSSTLPTKPSGSTIADGLTGAVVFPSGHRVVAVRDATQYVTTDSSQSLTLPVTSSSTGPIPYSRLNAADALAYVKTNATATAEYGREILLYGDFEDGDIDGSFSEGSAWDQSPARYVQNSVVRSGTGAAVLLRSSTNTTQAVLENVNRIGFPAGNKLTLTGWIKGDNAGLFKVGVRTYSASGTMLTNTEPYSKAASTYGWTKFTVNITPSSTATSIRLSFKESAPTEGEGRVYIDDVSLIEWEGSVTTALSGFTLPTPNNYSWLRFTTSATTSLGVTLTHRSYELP